MTSHGVARTSGARTPAQRQAEQQKIATYRALDSKLLSLNEAGDSFSDPETLTLTSQVLTHNPEHYTAWNVRRRCLTCGSLSRPSPGSSSSVPPVTSSAPSTASPSSGGLSASPSATTQPPQPSQPQGESGKSGTIPDQINSTETKNDDAATQRSDEVIATLRSELMFTLPLIKANPKCYWIWNYRLWLLRQAIVLLDRPVAWRVWEEELALVALLLNKDKRNFHAWGYRRHIVRKLEGPEFGGKSLAEDEFLYAQRMITSITSGLSNFSAWHHRGKIIPRLLAERGASDEDRRKFLDSELDLVRRALDVGPEDQSCWYYQQFLIDNITGPASPASIAPNLPAEEKVTILREEIANINELLEDYDCEMKLAYDALMEYTLLLGRVQGRSTNDEEKTELKAWLDKLRKLDPQRKGRWDDFEVEHQLAV